MSQGLANADIGESLAISEKTVRNHVSNLFDKLGVWTRAQAIVFARDRGFRPLSWASDLATAFSFAGPRLVSSVTILTKLGCSSPETRNVQR